MKPITLITGASKGIGKALVEYLIDRDHIVVGCSRRAPEWELSGFHHLEADVASEADASRVCRQVHKEHGRIDNLINCAGIASMNHALLTPGKSVEKVLATNTLGTFLFSREAAKVMQRKKFGRIVNFTTVAVPMHLHGEAAYAASKAAVEELTRVLAREFADFGITVNAVGPGPIKTDLIAGVPDAKIDALIRRQAIKRLGEFADVCNVVDFFLRPESEFISGQIVYLGGV